MPTQYSSILTSATNFYIAQMKKLSVAETYGLKSCGVTWGQMTNLNLILNALVEGGGVNPGVQASYTVTVIGGKNVQVVSGQIGNSVYPTLTMTPNVTFTATQVAAAIATFINSLTSASYPYTASSSGSSLTIYGQNFTADNGTSIFFQININPGFGQSISGTLTGAIAPPILSFDDQECLLGKLQEIIAKGF